MSHTHAVYDSASVSARSAANYLLYVWRCTFISRPNECNSMIFNRPKVVGMQRGERKVRG
jgi:hypothetical protein